MTCHACVYNVRATNTHPQVGACCISTHHVRSRDRLLCKKGHHSPGSKLSKDPKHPDDHGGHHDQVCRPPGRGTQVALRACAIITRLLLPQVTRSVLLCISAPRTRRAPSREHRAQCLPRLPTLARRLTPVRWGDWALVFRTMLAWFASVPPEELEQEITAAFRLFDVGPLPLARTLSYASNPIPKPQTPKPGECERVQLCVITLGETLWVVE